MNPTNYYNQNDWVNSVGGVVKQQRWKEESPSSTLHRTSHGVQNEFVRKSGTGLRSVERW